MQYNKQRSQVNPFLLPFIIYFLVAKRDIQTHPKDSIPSFAFIGYDFHFSPLKLDVKKFIL